MRFWRSIGLLVLALGILAVPAHAAKKPKKERPPKAASVKAEKPAKVAAAPKPKKEKPTKTASRSSPERRAWMFGVNPGYGGARFVGTWKTLVGELRSDTPTEYPPLVTGHPDWVGTQIESATSFQYRMGYSVNPRLMIGFERAQWFKDFGPYSWRFNTSLMSATCYPRAGHLFVRGGAGLSSMTEEIPTTPPFFRQFSDRGFGLEAALGYEFRLFHRTSLAPEVAIRSMTFGEEVRAQMASASLAFNLWF